MTEDIEAHDELPLGYRQAMTDAGVVPLWPMMRDVLPHGEPRPRTKTGNWPYSSLRSLLLRAGELTPVERAECRVLVLFDPSSNIGAMRTTASIYIGLQLLLPGEIAPAHRHTPSAARIVIEGQGAYTVVNGEKLVMAEGDLVLTPGGEWHDHGHEGNEPVIWLDTLDLPLLCYLEGSYAEEGPLQARNNRPDASQVEYVTAGLVPPIKHGQEPRRYPMRRFPWTRTEAALRELAKYAGEDSIELNYVNRRTGEDVLPTIGFTAMMLRNGEKLSANRSSTSAVYHVVKGSGFSTINGEIVEWSSKQIFSAPVFTKTEHIANEESFLVRIHDRPLQEKLGYYEERNRNG